MHKTIISDANCLPILYEIGGLEILNKLYGQVYTTSVIAKKFKGELPSWVIIESITDAMHQNILEIKLAKEESSAMALALENPDCTLILEKANAIIIAQKFKLRFTGILEILIKAKQNGIIPFVKPFLEKIKGTDYKISKELELFVLKEVKEL